jgi:ubiquinone/menaquinone biosynthesis C-methylase UbiE
MVNDRINWAGKEQNCRAIQDTALNLKLEDESFDTVVSIGCLHHTGDIKKAISEVHRVLRKNGTAVIMLYNKKSFRIQISRPFTYYFIQGNLFKKSSVGYAEFLRGTYDNNAKEEAAPVTDYFSKSDICDLFKDFSSVSIHNENFDEFSIRLFGKVLFLPRKHFMNNIAKFWGLDNYIIAKK